MRSVFSLKKISWFIVTLIVFSQINGCNNNDSVSKKEAVPVSQNDDQLFKKYNLNRIALPTGFKINVYAEAADARSLCISPNGTVFVGSRENKVYAITDANHDGKADKVYTIVSGLNTPNGVAFKDGSLYIGTISTIYRIDNIESNLANPSKPVVVYDKYPTESIMAQNLLHLALMENYMFRSEHLVIFVSLQSLMLLSPASILMAQALKFLQPVCEIQLALHGAL